MNKKQLIRHEFEILKQGGCSKQGAIEILAERHNVGYDTCSRYLRKDNRKENRMKKKNMKIGKRLLYIPDTQIKVDGTTEHIKAVARYAVEKQPDYIVLAGDWHDMPSLSVFNTKRGSEGLRVYDDIGAGNDALDEFMDIINQIPKRSRPEIHISLGNHSCKVRIERYLNSHPELEGMLEDIGTAHFHKHGIVVHDFLEIAKIEGIAFSHYFANPHSLKGAPVGGTIDNMLKNVGMSFVMGHQQTYKSAKHYLGDGTCRIGIVAGAFYPHDEDYMSIQSNRHWRGCVMLNELDGEGGADICEVSLQYLMNNYVE